MEEIILTLNKNKKGKLEISIDPGSNTEPKLFLTASKDFAIILKRELVMQQARRHPSPVLQEAIKRIESCFSPGTLDEHDFYESIERMGREGW